MGSCRQRWGVGVRQNKRFVARAAILLTGPTKTTRPCAWPRPSFIQ